MYGGRGGGIGVNPTRPWGGGHTGVFLYPPPASKVAQVLKKTLLSGGGGGHFFPSYKFWVNFPDTG